MSSVTSQAHAAVLPVRRTRHRRNRALIAGGSVIGLIFAVAILAPVLARYPAEVAQPSESLLPPSGAHWFGTDASGFDIYSRVLYAARTDLIIGIAGTGIAMGIGAIIGMAIGSIGGFLDSLISRIVDLLQSIPLFVTALLMVTLFGQRMSNIIIAVTIVYLPLYVRTFRSETKALAERAFVRSARISGAGRSTILARHVLPNAVAPALGQWATSVGWAILMAAGLGFVGAGLKPPTAEWGAMISGGASLVSTGKWWVAIFPGLAIVITVAGFTLLSEGLEQHFNPRKDG
ncbi:MAG: peptide/nickel transport system permease protein [Solirubrobacterales bacterium]|jgi:peptide/nickel transport system permease protein|nr:peptide/nickel transport system permease protein [Solirubrobacterales bacterium]